MPECALCGDYESEHQPGCRVRNYYGSGRNDYTVCECPGFEPLNEHQEATA